MRAQFDVFGSDWTIFPLHLGLYLLQAQPVPVYAGSMYAGSVWTQLLTALVVGILTAFAFQFLVTNLGIAIGISVLGMRATGRAHSVDQTNDRFANDSAGSVEGAIAESDKPEHSSSNFSTMAGLSILLTVDLVLFGACFLAAKFSQVSSPMSGAIAGIVIWSAYFLLLLWISSTAVSSFVGTVLGATTEGLRRIVSTISSALSNSEDDSVTQEQMIATIREEMQAALDAVNLQQMVDEQMQTILEAEMPRLQPEVALPAAQPHRATELWQELETYLLETSSTNLTPKRVDRKLQKLLQKTKVKIFETDSIPDFDRTILVQQLDQREDISSKKRNRILNQLEKTWEEYWQEQLLTSKESEQANLQPPEEQQSETSSGLSQVAALLLKSTADPMLKQALPYLPEILQRLQRSTPNWGEVAPIVLPAVLAKIRQSIETPDSGDAASTDYADTSHAGLNYADLKQHLEPLVKSSQLGWDSLNHALMKPIEQLHDQSRQQTESIQKSAQERVEQVKQQAQRRLKNTRKAAATAAWWLFLTATTGALSSALAGALAAGFSVTQLLPR